MKRLRALGAMLIVAFAAKALAEDDDAKAIASAQCVALVRAFDAHDVPALVALYEPDADAVVIAGSSAQTVQLVRLQGQNEARQVYTTFFERFPRARLKLTVESARFLTPALLVSDQAYEITGLPADAGPVRAVTFVVRRKQGDNWLIVCERHLAQTPVPSLDPKPPGP